MIWTNKLNYYYYYYYYYYPEATIKVGILCPNHMVSNFICSGLNFLQFASVQTLWKFPIVFYVHFFWCPDRQLSFNDILELFNNDCCLLPKLEHGFSLGWTLKDNGKKSFRLRQLVGFFSPYGCLNIETSRLRLFLSGMNINQLGKISWKINHNDKYTIKFKKSGLSISR